MFEGRDYRVVIVNGKLIAASERIPAHVIGDGIRTVAELIKMENDNPFRGDGHEKPLTKICHVKAACSLGHDGLSMEYVPTAGAFVKLCGTANISTGGTARDVTDQVHETVRTVCERAAKIIGLDIAGIDLMTPDISKRMPERAGIIEVNAGPGLRMHYHPTEGEPRDIGAAIVDMLYPSPDTGRIPTVAITGTNGKTTVARMIERVLSEQFGTVGLTTTEGTWIGGRQVASVDATWPWSARLVLGEPAIEDCPGGHNQNIVCDIQ
jgi:cyanophycin synthetase